MRLSAKGLMGLVLCAAVTAQGTENWVNYESPHVHPLELLATGLLVGAVNTEDARLEVFSADGTGGYFHYGSVPVGLDPVSVRDAGFQFAWVVNHVSDSISVVDVLEMSVVETIQTPDEPSDVVFTIDQNTGDQWAWVSCSQPAVVAAYNVTAGPPWTPTLIPIEGADPRAMLTDGELVYVGIHSSGNRTTILAGDRIGTASNARFMANVMTDVDNASGGVTPPSNIPGGVGFNPPLAAGLPSPPETGLIVRGNANGWFDDAGRDWTMDVTDGRFDRVPGWDLCDHDVAIIDTRTNPWTVTYAGGGMTTVMALGMQPSPAPGVLPRLSFVGTEAKNEIRFEPNLKNKFVRSQIAFVDADNLDVTSRDLNPHLGNYTASSIPQIDRDKSIGEPRAVIWDLFSGTTRGFVAGMGSNNVIEIDRDGNRMREIEVGAGPTGLAQFAGAFLFVLNRFDSSILVHNLSTDAQEVLRFHSPLPDDVRAGRKHLHDTHRTSGYGHVSCASCHVDAREDGLAWDLGNPERTLRIAHAPNMDRRPDIVPRVGGSAYPEESEHPYAGVHHPMKGPMVTQTLQDIIGNEPFHWRGDKKSIEEFNEAYVGLLGDDVPLSKVEMSQLKTYLESISVPPNPHRLKYENGFGGLATNVPLPRQYYYPLDPAGAAQPLVEGNAQNGLDIYIETCNVCHTVPVGIGTESTWTGTSWSPAAPVGGHGERFSSLLTADGVSHHSMKVPELRHLHEKVGFDALQQRNVRGFGYLHDGSVDTLSRFVSEFRDRPRFQPDPVQATADVTAFLMSFSSTGMEAWSTNNENFPPGRLDAKNSHPAVGRQWTLDSSVMNPEDVQAIAEMFSVVDANPNELTLIVKQSLDTPGTLGYWYVGTNLFIDDSHRITDAISLLTSIGPGTEATFTIVPASQGQRLGVDRDRDGAYDGVEPLLGGDPADRDIAGCVGTPPPLPQQPSIASYATPQGPFEMQIRWWRGSTSVDEGFILERIWGNSPQWERVATVPATSATQYTYVDKTVGESTSYRYRVRAYNCIGKSDWSEQPPLNTRTTPARGAQRLCHVHAIDLQLAPGDTEQMVRAYGTVNVVDEEGIGIAGVTVSLTVAGSSGAGSYTAVTNDDGQALFEPGTFVGVDQAPSWTFTVTGISGANVTYDSSNNFESTKLVHFTDG